MYLDAEYGESAPLQLMSAVLLYGSEQKIRLATIHQPVRDPRGGPALLDAGEPLTREFLDKMTRGLGSELPARFLPDNVLIYSTQLTAWWEPPQIRSMFFARDCDGKTLDGEEGGETLPPSRAFVRRAQRPFDGLGPRGREAA